MEGRWHHTRHRVATPIERQRLSDNSGIGAEPLPERVGNHHTGIVIEPPAENRNNAQLPHKGQRDHDSLDMVRLTGESQVLSGVAKPSKCVEGSSPLLICTRIFG